MDLGTDRALRFEQQVTALVRAYSRADRRRAYVVFAAGNHFEPMPPNHGLPLTDAQMIYTAGLEVALDEIDRAILMTREHGST